MRHRKQRFRGKLREDHDSLVEEVRLKLAKQHTRYELPETTQTFRERSISEVVGELDIPVSTVPSQQFKHVGDLKPDLLLTHAEDDSITIVEVTTAKPAGTMKSGAALQTKIRDDSEKLRKMQEFFVATGKFTDCRMRIAYMGGGGGLTIRPPPEKSP